MPIKQKERARLASDEAALDFAEVELQKNNQLIASATADYDVMERVLTILAALAVVIAVGRFIRRALPALRAAVVLRQGQLKAQAAANREAIAVIERAKAAARAQLEVVE